MGKAMREIPEEDIGTTIKAVSQGGDA